MRAEATIRAGQKMRAVLEEMEAPKTVVEVGLPCLEMAPQKEEMETMTRMQEMKMVVSNP